MFVSGRDQICYPRSMVERLKLCQGCDQKLVAAKAEFDRKYSGHGEQYRRQRSTNDVAAVGEDNEYRSVISGLAEWVGLLVDPPIHT